MHISGPLSLPPRGKEKNDFFLSYSQIYVDPATDISRYISIYIMHLYVSVNPGSFIVYLLLNPVVTINFPSLAIIYLVSNLHCQLHVCSMRFSGAKANCSY